jgi:hypothetical protein
MLRVQSILFLVGEAMNLDDLRKMAAAEVARFDHAREQAKRHHMGFPNDPAETISRALIALVDVAENTRHVHAVRKGHRLSYNRACPLCGSLDKLDEFMASMQHGAPHA